MENAVANTSAKIQVFGNFEQQGEVLSDTIQQITMSLTHVVCQIQIIMNVVYARYSVIERLELWMNFEDIPEIPTILGQLGWDFNVIIEESEMLGGFPITRLEIDDFVQCLSLCNLQELIYTESAYTRWNGKIEEDNIFNRLGRVLGNQEFLQEFPISEVHHLIRQGSDQALIILSYT